MKRTEAAYLAGLFDGEGTFSLRLAPTNRAGRGWNFIPFAQIANSDTKMLDFAAQVTKHGWVWKFYKHGGRKLPNCVWISRSTKQLRQWLPEILPFLITKHPQATLVLQACQILHGLPKNRATAKYSMAFNSAIPKLARIYNRIEKLNSRGGRWQVRWAIDSKHVANSSP